MCNTARDTYLAALRAGKYIKSPTVEQMLSVCPHLTEVQLLEALSRSGNHTIALPPLLIRHSYRLATYHPGSVNGSKSSFRVWDYNQRTLRSYADGKLHGDVLEDYPFMNEAMAYAEEHWPQELILDNWTDFQQVFIREPGVSEVKFIISIGLGRYWNELIDDRSKPEVMLWDKAIVTASVDPLIFPEIRGKRGGFLKSNCARCGGGFGLGLCLACDTTPLGDYWDTPLPPKLIKLLRDNGHKFALDPERLIPVDKEV